MGGNSLTPTDNLDIYFDAFTSKQRYNNDKSQLGTLDDASLATKQTSGYKDKLDLKENSFT